MNNDYEARTPTLFKLLVVAGVVVLAASLVWTITNPSTLGVAGIVIGVVCLIPAGLARLATNAALKRRFHVRDAIVQHAALKGNEQVLDIGTGSGITLFGLAKHLTTGKGVGIDVYHEGDGGGSPDIFWKNARKEGVKDRVDLKQMDAREMSFANESFDVVISTFAFHHIGGGDARRKAAREIVRVLRPGGRVLVCDMGLALNELEQVMRDAGLSVHRHGDQMAFVMGQKAA